jgi:membrane protein required for colicin V production
MAQWGWVDIALLAVLAASMLVGLLRGLVFEVLSLAGWVVAYVAAQWLAPAVAPHVAVGAPGSAINAGTAFFIVFAVVLIAWSLAARLVKMLVHATPLSLPDRVLGAGFGALRGLVVLLVLATVVAMTPAVRSAAWQGSQGAGWLALALAQLRPMLPAAAAQHLPDELK